MFGKRIDPFDEAEPAEEAAAETEQEVIFVYRSLSRLCPVSRVLAKALQIHRGLFLYYMTDDESAAV